MIRVIFLMGLLFVSMVSFSQKAMDTPCYTEKFAPEGEYEDKVFTRLDIQASFKGGYSKWRNFIEKNISFEKIIQSLPDSINDYQDSAIIRFIVSREGRMSDIEVVHAGTTEIANEAVRLIKLSACNWVPGINGGRLLNAYRVEKFIFFVKGNDQAQARIGVKFD